MNKRVASEDYVDNPQWQSHSLRIPFLLRQLLQNSDTFLTQTLDTIRSKSKNKNIFSPFLRQKNLCLQEVRIMITIESLYKEKYFKIIKI